MRNLERQSKRRKKVLVQALVSGHGASPEIKCAIRDASSFGCMPVSSQVSELPEVITIPVDGIEQPICGKIIWCSDRMAGVQFDWPDSANFETVETDWTDLDSDKIISASEGVQPLNYHQNMRQYSYLPRIRIAPSNSWGNFELMPHYEFYFYNT